ncbi:MAG TPA: type VI secretion system tip protein TssI/VgrG [Rhodocyclaceae bacterium]|nr:type VI secretion system tip protein TssI/VgrG [Rhodocyclaceae bacterium]
MATIDDSNRLLAITTPLGDDALMVERFWGEERMSGLYGFTLEFASENNAVDFTQVVGSPAALRIKTPGDDRYLHGIISRFAQIGGEAQRFRYRAELVPWLWYLQYTSDSRIFQDKSVPDIIEAVFNARGFSDFKKSLSKSYNPRTYCVQYRESDFAFVSRLMEEEGIFYFFEHEQSKHTLVLADAVSATASCPVKSTLPYRPEAGITDGDDVSEWLQSLTIVPAKVSLRDFDFEQPSADLTVTSPTIATKAKKSALDLYDYPGGYTQTSNGDAYAKLQMEIFEAAQQRSEGRSDCRTLAAGYKFTLTSHFNDNCNIEHLLVSVRHEATNNLPWQGEDATYTNQFVCQPSATAFCAERITPRPIMHGAQTAMVVGPSGEEIYTDKYGRVKVQFHWDRVGAKDDKSSCWIRVSQGWAGLTWGAMHIPRVGQEVIVDFLEGDPDQPIVTGRVYNAEKMPPYTLPDNKTQSGLKSRSSPNGTAENFNELRFEDKKDNEDVYFQAEKDFHRVVKNDDDLKIGHDQTEEVKNNRTTTIQEGNDALTVSKGNRDVTISEGNFSHTVTKGTQTVTVEGDDTYTVKTGKRTVTVETGDDTHEVKTGKRVVLVDTGDDMTTVKTGKRNVTVETGNDEHIIKTGNRTVEVSLGNDELTVKVGNQTTKVSVGKSSTEALGGIELKVGGNSVKIDQSGVTISGMNVKITGQIQAEVSAPMAKVSGDGMLTLKGGVTMIN